MKSPKTLCSFLVLQVLVCTCAAGERLVIHEWGTFTSFQNELGEAISGINTDDEPVPDFVHRFGSQTTFPRTDFPSEPPRSKGTRYSSPLVAMRLETPVIYFHLPENEKSKTVDVSVEFRGGLLTEFFPRAQAIVDGKPVVKYDIPDKGLQRLQLKWPGIRIGESGTMPKTTEHVWTTPRQVKAAPITIGEESEKFVFYRGVADLASPLRVVRYADQILDIRIDWPALQKVAALVTRDASPGSADSDPTKTFLANAPWEKIVAKRQLWLLEVRRDGTSAYRRLPTSKPAITSERLATTSAVFKDKDFTSENLHLLRSEMHAALLGEGMFADEADALLETWQLSYFLSPGQRLFYMVPREWTDAVLPLSVSEKSDISRAMVGRIELVTPRQRDLIRQIAETPVPDLTAVLEKMKTLRNDPARRDAYNALASGRGDVKDLGVIVPPIYEAFLDLGRFRVPLLRNTVVRADQADAAHLDRVRHLEFELRFPGKLVRE